MSEGVCAQLSSGIWGLCNPVTTNIKPLCTQHGAEARRMDAPLWLLSCWFKCPNLKPCMWLIPRCSDQVPHWSKRRANAMSHDMARPQLILTCVCYRNFSFSVLTEMNLSPREKKSNLYDWSCFCQRKKGYLLPGRTKLLLFKEPKTWIWPLLQVL